ncbi:MAG: hypothetical protein OD814_000081 [Candidatus Alkanophagales archaeon MCA70_species_1]|nr:hypothetical protein [Candidatus Alkanophaga volatiphilum]
MGKVLYLKPEAGRLKVKPRLRSGEAHDPEALRFINENAGTDDWWP